MSEEMRSQISNWLDANVWDGDSLSQSSNIMRIGASKAVFNPHDLYDLVCECLEDIEREEKG